MKNLHRKTDFCKVWTTLQCGPFTNLWKLFLVNNFFNRQNELKLNENNYLKIILFVKAGEEKTMWPKNWQKHRSICFIWSCCNRLYTAIINVKLAETNSTFSYLRHPKIKPIICTTRLKPEQHNFCRQTSFSLRLTTVLLKIFLCT